MHQGWGMDIFFGVVVWIVAGTLAYRYLIDPQH